MSTDKNESKEVQYSSKSSQKVSEEKQNKEKSALVSSEDNRQ